MANETSKTSTSKVDDKVNEAKARLNQAKQRLADVRNVLSEARTTRDTLVSDAEKAYSEAYGEARDEQRSALTDLDNAYAEMRQEIVDRFTIASETLREARDVAVKSAQTDYDDTVEAAQRTYGES